MFNDAIHKNENLLAFAVPYLDLTGATPHFFIGGTTNSQNYFEI